MWWEHPIVLGVGALAILIAGVSTIWGKGIVPTYHGVVRFLKALRKFADSVDVLFQIADQFKPNGGHSLHDRMKRIEETQQVLALDMSEVKRQVETVITEELPIIAALAEHVIDSGDRR